MPKLSVIIPTLNSGEHLREALDYLIEQSEDDFEVIIVDCMSTDNTAEIIDEFCEEYVDFFRVDFDSQNIYAAMNKGFELAKGNYVWFYSPDGRVNANTVEAFLEVAEAREADAVTSRLWHYGDFDPYYDIYCDATVVLPKFEKYERSVLWDNELSNKIFRRASLIAKKLKLPENFKYAEGIFNLKVMFSGMKITGCAPAVYQRREYRGFEGFSPHLEPTLENAKAFVAKMTEIFALCEDEIRRDSGAFDGDEAFIQEAYYVTTSTLLESFYRYFWLLDAETLEYVFLQAEKFANLLTTERAKKLKETHEDLFKASIYKTHDEAAKNPEFSMLLDIAAASEYERLINSLYLQQFPFFELFVRQSQYDDENFPQKWKKSANLHVLPDAGFHANARKQSRSKVSINMRDGKPIDTRVLKSVFLSAAPLFTKPLIFSQTKNSYSVKRSLKEKGLNIS